MQETLFTEKNQLKGDFDECKFAINKTKCIYWQILKHLATLLSSVEGNTYLGISL